MTAAVRPASHFDELFRDDADPWRTRTLWYERRKRALTLAALPAARYERAFEPGCAGGELTAALAARCGQVVASDASAAAVAHARARVAGLPATIEHGAIPGQWPDGRFDLIVLSELGYYLSRGALERVVQACRASLTDDGSLLACHWRHGAPDMLQPAEAVHAAVGAGCGLRRLSHYEDDDLLLDVWSGDGRSVARREGLA